MHEQCDTLLKDKQQLGAFAEALRSKLGYFDELERVSAVFSGGTEAVKHEHFSQLLERLDECVSRVETDRNEIRGKCNLESVLSQVMSRIFEPGFRVKHGGAGRSRE